MFSVIENSVNLDAVNFDSLYLVKLIFGKYFYFDANRVADLLQLDAIRVPVRERVNVCINSNFTFPAHNHPWQHYLYFMTPVGLWSLVHQSCASLRVTWLLISSFNMVWEIAIRMISIFLGIEILVSYSVNYFFLLYSSISTDLCVVIIFYV